jgi:integrase
MRGSYREYRQGCFKVVFYWQGERFEVYRYKDGTPLVHAKMCERLLEHINAQIDSHEFDPSDWRKDKPFMFERAVETWIKLKMVSRETLDSRERIAKKYLIPFFGGRDIRDIRRIHIDEFLTSLKAQGCSDKYCYNILAELKACIRFHADSIPRLPTFPTVEFQEKPIRWLTQDQQDKVFEFIPDQDKPIFIFQRYTGCRPNEARGLLRENVHRDKGIIVIATVLDSHGVLREKTKTKRIRVLPIIPEIEECLKPREVSKFVFTKKGLPYIKRTHEKIWHSANLKAHKVYGVPIVSMYPGTKHSFGMQRLNQGFSKDLLQTVFGHTDKKTTERYAKYLTETLSEVMSGKIIPYGANVVQKDGRSQLRK